MFLDIISAFLTVRTMFLLVFDGSLDLQRTCTSHWRHNGVKIQGRKQNISTLQLMIQWMQLIYASLVAKPSQQSLQSICPRILMVGSHGDKIDESKKTNVLKQLTCTSAPFNAIVIDKLIVDNTKAGRGKDEDPGYRKIRKSVHEFAESLTVETPLAWIQFRKVLIKTATEQKKQKPILSYHEVVTVAETCNIPETKVASVLYFYHELGVFLHYNDIKSLSNTIFLEPRWLFQQLCKLLMPQYYHSELQIPISWREDLENYGILTRPFYQKISCGCGLEPEALVELLDNFDLAKKITKCPEKFQHIAGDKYFIPCMLNMKPSLGSDPTEHQSPSSSRKAATLHIVFKMGFVPPGFFVRLAAQMTTKLEPLFDGHVYRDSITFEYGEYDIVTISEPPSLRSIQVDVAEIAKRKKARCTFADSCLSFRNELYKMSINVLCWLQSIELYFAFVCEKDSENFIDLKMKKLGERVVSEKHQESPMYCKKCHKELEMAQEHKYWLPAPPQVSMSYLLYDFMTADHL